MSSQASEAPAVNSSYASVPAVELSDEQREFVERLKRLYKVDHQAEYLYLQAEVDSLWIQLEQAKALHQTAI